MNAHQPGVPLYNPPPVNNQEMEMQRIKDQLQRELDEIKQQADMAMRERDESKRLLDELNRELEDKIKDEELYREKLRRALANTSTEPPQKDSSQNSSLKPPLKIYGIKGTSEYYDDIAASIALECQTKFVPYGIGSQAALSKDDSKLFGLLDDGSDIFRHIARKSYGQMIIGNSAVGQIKTSKNMVNPEGSGLDHEKVFGDIEKIMNDYYKEKLMKQKNEMLGDKLR